MQELKISRDVKDLNIKLGGQLQDLLLLIKLKFLIMMTRPHMSFYLNVLQPCYHQQQEALVTQFDFTSFNLGLF